MANYQDEALESLRKLKQKEKSKEDEKASNAKRQEEINSIRNSANKRKEGEKLNVEQRETIGQRNRLRKSLAEKKLNHEKQVLVSQRNNVPYKEVIALHDQIKAKYHPSNNRKAFMDSTYKAPHRNDDDEIFVPG